MYGLCVITSKSWNTFITCSFIRTWWMAVWIFFFVFLFSNKIFLLYKSPELVQVMRSIGNKLANSIWEANIKNRVKPQPNTSSYVLIICQYFHFWFHLRTERERWIRDKYEQKLFLAPLAISPPLARQTLIDAINKTDLYTVILILAHRKLSNEDVNSSLLHLAASQGNVTILQLLLWVRRKIF